MQEEPAVCSLRSEAGKGVRKHDFGEANGKTEAVGEEKVLV